MADAAAVLTKQVGPFPLWGWGAIGGAGIGLGVVLRRSSLFDGKTTLSDPAAETDPNAAGVDVGPAYGAVPLAGSAGGQVPTSVDPPDLTNEQWLHSAVSYLIASQGVSPASADTALRLYLTGQKLTAQQVAIVGLAIRHAGTPPEGAPPIDGPTAQPAPPTAPPPAPWHPYPIRYHTYMAGQTVQNIALVVYGDRNKWPVITAANRYIFGPDKANGPTRYPPSGTRIVLPYLTPPPPAPHPAPAPPHPAPHPTRYHTLGRGQTLPDIALVAYHDRNKWRKITAANRTLFGTDKPNGPGRMPPVGTRIILPY